MSKIDKEESEILDAFLSQFVSYCMTLLSQESRVPSFRSKSYCCIFSSCWVSTTANTSIILQSWIFLFPSISDHIDEEV